jgi:CTP synthase
MANSKPDTKFVFVTGGVLSGVGKGITAASIGSVLKARGLSVNIQKCDPYLNMDAGTLNPAEHGECFVTKDGAETDLDLGHYERFLDIELTQSSSLMSGRILSQVIAGERAGKYLGKTVQIIPHVTNAIKDEIIRNGEGFDVHIVEIGGTVGDYESLSFIEAIRELAIQIGRERCMFAHVVYLPYLGASKEFKTKPAQNAVRELRGLGIVPDMLVARSEEQPPADVVPKLSLHSGVDPSCIILMPTASTIYQVPLTLHEAGIGEIILNRLGLASRASKPDMSVWEDVVRNANKKYDKKVTVGVVAKYLNNQDTYMSVFEALRAAAWANKVGLEIVWIDSEKLEKQTDPEASLKGLDGILVPGGFGLRGGEGKILAAGYALRQKVPYLGLCLGLQVAVVAAARGGGLKDANSTEFNPKTPDPVISTMADQLGKENTGGSMRLGNYDCVLEPGSLAMKLYGQKTITERHRHRYEANNTYRPHYGEWGITASGHSPDGTLVEMIEAIDHRFFISTQAHPEFRSRPHAPHPLFDGFLRACK